MQVILSGSLRHFPPGDLLLLLSSRSMRATCDFESGGKRTRVFVDGDKVIGAEASGGGEAGAAVLDVLEWPGGTFTVLDAATLPDGVKPLALAIQALVDEAKKRAQASRVYQDGTTFRVVDDPLQQQLSLTAEDLKLLFRLTSARPFKDLVAQLGMGREELAAKLRHLEGLGLLLREDPQPVSQATQMTQATQVGSGTASGTGSKRRILVGSLTPDNAPDTVYPLLDAEQTVGRAPSNSICIADGSISSVHARITRTAEGFFLEDLQSRNGTFVNGEKVDSKRLLTDGDLIRFGKIITTFNVAREGKAGETTQPEVRRKRSLRSSAVRL
ncbi:MAG TPA: FHA domain-containing protein, partial [Thermoanaerobaculia bacterium]|nr:FHA domain-containing protein [Thermoanaerobaculia bacterium]